MPYGSDSPYPGPEDAPQPHPTVRIITTTITVTAIAVVVVILFNPWAEKAKEIRKEQVKAEAAEKEHERLEEERLAKYAALETNVKSLLKDADQNHSQFETTAKAVFAEVETVARRSLDRLTADPPDVPKPIVNAQRFVEEFRTPWNELLNAYTATKDLRAGKVLASINEKVEKHGLTEADRDSLTAFIYGLDKAKDRLSAQRGNLDTVRRILAQRELDSISSQPERSSP